MQVAINGICRIHTCAKEANSLPNVHGKIFTVVRWSTLYKPFLCTPTKSLMTWHTPLFSCNVPLIVKEFNKVSHILLLFISSSIQTTGLPSLDISNLQNVS